MSINEYINDVASYLCGISIPDGAHIDFLEKKNYLFACFPSDKYNDIVSYMLQKVNQLPHHKEQNAIYIVNSISSLMIEIADLYMLSGILDLT